MSTLSSSVSSASHSAHTTVLLHEAVNALLPEDATADRDGVYIDATFGRGGHSALMLECLQKRSAQARVLALDKDADAVSVAQSDARFAQALQDGRFAVRHTPFTALADEEPASVSGILMDLGVSSPQLDEADRGFSFMHDGPLDMRMDAQNGQSVQQWLATVPEADLARVIQQYGEEKKAKAVARAIVRHREQGGALSRTLELAQVVADVVGYREKGKHPATRTFQALRIFINDELAQLRQALEASLRVLRTGGRLVVISFHSLEDRMVKQFIAQHSKEVVDKSRRDWMLQAPKPLLLRSVGRVKPSAEEVEANPRARSAVMRVAERTDVAWSADLAHSGGLA